MHISIKLICRVTSCEMPGWMKYKLESRFPGEISITSDDTTLTAESRGTRQTLNESERGK